MNNTMRVSVHSLQFRNDTALQKGETMETRSNYYKLALETVYEVSKVLSSNYQCSTTMQGVLSIVCNNLNMRRAMIMLYDDETRELTLKASVGLSTNMIGALRYRLNEGVVGKAFRHGMSILVPDISDEPGFLNRVEREMSDEKLSFLAVPIKEGSNEYGVLTVDKPTAEIFSYSTEFDMLKMIATLIASFLRKSNFITHEWQQIGAERDRLSQEVLGRFRMSGLIGRGKNMRKVFEQIQLMSRSRSNCLIRGESGTGKEVVAKTIHYNSARSHKPFVAINCAAIPKELLEAELFGHEKGAFTGALARRKGKFELADGGTLFLDEIGDMPLDAQSKLLRVLQEKSLERVGGNEVIPVDVRVIAATHKPLETMVQEKTFRLDLYYRLNVLIIELPPLRERREDIPLLAQHIVDKINNTYEMQLKIAPQLFAPLSRCCWPGNIRELENCLERAALNATDNIIRTADLLCGRHEPCPSQIIGHATNDAIAPQVATLKHSNAISAAKKVDHSEPNHERMRFEQGDEIEAVSLALRRSGYVQAKAARTLGITVRQLRYRIQKYSIEVKRF